MQILPLDLFRAGTDARAGVDRSAVDAARSVASGGTVNQTATARAAIFADAVLGAMRARIEELRAVAK